jgi:hypothetical protein
MGIALGGFGFSSRGSATVSLITVPPHEVATTHNTAIDKVAPTRDAGKRKKRFRNGEPRENL